MGLSEDELAEVLERGGIEDNDDSSDSGAVPSSPIRDSELLPLAKWCSCALYHAEEEELEQQRNRLTQLMITNELGEDSLGSTANLRAGPSSPFTSKHTTPLLPTCQRGGGGAI